MCYTLFLVGRIGSAINATLYEKLNFNFIGDNCAGREHQPRCELLWLSIRSFPAATVPEFVGSSKEQSWHDQHGVAGHRGARNTSPASCSR